MPTVASLVMFAADAERTAGFYRALGVTLEDESHEGGAVHFAAELGDVHVAVYAAQSDGIAPAPRSSGATFAGVFIDNLDELAGLLTERTITGHEQMPWGCRIVVEDPDGRAVELSQPGHCS